MSGERGLLWVNAFVHALLGSSSYSQHRPLSLHGAGFEGQTPMGAFHTAMLEGLFSPEHANSVAKLKHFTKLHEKSVNVNSTNI